MPGPLVRCTVVDKLVHPMPQDVGPTISAGPETILHAKDEIVSVEVSNTVVSDGDGRGGRAKTTTAIFDTDEGPRADTSIEALAKLRPVFHVHGTVTAGNS